MTNSSISSFNSINDNVKKYTNDFSFVDILASFVGNNRFKSGYLQLKQGKQNALTYLWEALSAVGNDISETVYSNVLNYIDNISNVDLCKVTALRSTLQMYGVSQSMLDFIDIVPLEIRNIIDVLSINKKYLIQSGIIKNSLLNDIRNTIVKTHYTEDELAEQYSLKFRNNYTITNNYNTTNLEGTYDLINDYSLTSYDCHINDNLSINICRNYVLQEYLSSISYDAECSGILPDSTLLCAVQILQNSLNKFNLITNDIFIDEHLYGIFTNISTTYYLSTENGNYRDFLSSTKLVGLVYELEKILNATTNDRRRYGQLFNNLTLDSMFNHFYTECEYSDYYLLKYDFDLYEQIKNEKFEEITTHTANRVYKMIDKLISDVNKQDLKDYVDLIARSVDDQKLIYIEKLKDFIDTCTNSIRKAIYAIEQLSAITDHSFVERNISNYTTDFQYTLLNLFGFMNKSIDDNEFYNYLSSMFYVVLSDVCDLHYNTNSPFYEKPIRSYISADLLVSYTQQNISSDSRFLKLKNGIDLSFNEQQIVDDIDNGIDSFDNYDGIKLEILKNEYDRRHTTLARTVGELTTRSSYYREQKVKEYFKFIENKFYGSHENMLSTSYILNDSYIEVDAANNKYRYLLQKDGITLDTKLLDFVSNDLALLTIYIARLRENIKIQALKYYMKGTFNLLSYVINEYLVEFSRLNYKLNTISDDSDPEISSYTENEINALITVKNKLSTHMFDDIQIVEYDDLTEYYNLSTDTTLYARNSHLVNKDFWNNTSYKFSDITNNIESFYLNTLKCKDKITDIDKFLSTLYSIGADDTYIDANISTINVPNDTELSTYKFKNFIKWNGLNVGYLPYYNHKNMTHSSYLVHPNLYNFVEASKILYTIGNAFNNGIAREVINLTAIDNLKTNVGKFGQVIDIWKNNAFDFSGYKTSYEIGLHLSKANTNLLVEVADYDGAFYPPAVEAYINDKENFIYSIQTRQTTTDKSSYYERFYMHLGLSDEDLQYIVNLLRTQDTYTSTDYYNKIKDIVSPKNKKSDVYDIYKYATDRYGNAYILYKNYSIDERPYPEYDSANPTYTDKENTRGELWIRIKDHPIAFPAFSGKYPNVNINAKNANGKISYLSRVTVKDANNNIILADDMKYFYDFELDSAKRTILLNSYPVNNPNYRHISNYKNFYDKLEHSDIILCNIDLDLNVVTNKNSIILCEDDELRIDTLTNRNLIGRKYASDLSVIQSFIGYYKTSGMIAGVYVDKYFDNNGLKNGISSFGLDDGIEYIDSKCIDVKLSKYVYHSNSETETVQQQLNLIENGFDKYSFASPTVRFNYHDDVLSFTTLTTHDKDRQCTNYVGKNTKINSNTTYPNATSGYVIELAAVKQINSFDSFDKYVTTIDTRFIGNNIYTTNVDVFNLNSDSSYIPQYAGEAGKNELWMTNKYREQQYHAIELLGWSNDIDKVIDSVDPNKNVDIDVKSLESLIPGRVYEDFSGYNDKLIYVESNPAIYTNCVGIDMGNRFEWSLDLTQYFDSDKELSGLEFILYNDKGAKKSIYYVGSLVNLDLMLKEGKTIYANNYISSDSVNDILISTDVVDAKVTGTFNYFENSVNIADSQHIDNINNILLSYTSKGEKIGIVDNRTRTLTMSFYKNDIHKTSYIQSGIIKIVMYNKFNLKMYEYYHFLDERGIVDNDYPLSEYKTNPLLSDYAPYEYSYVMLSNLHNDGFLEIKYEEVSALIKDIVEPGTDNQKIYIKNMSIVDKNYLSDIIVFRGYDNMSFKYSDEEVYNAYDSRFYYPGYNMLYPTLNAALFGIQVSSYSLANLFTQSNIYIFQTENSKTFANKIGTIEIPVEFNETNCLRVFEDYSDQYGAENPAILSCVHFTTTDETKIYKEQTISGNTYLNIEDIDATYMPINNVLQRLRAVGYVHENTEMLSTDFEFETIKIHLNSSNTDLLNLLNIYVNYKVNTAGIVLYFNYYNYLNSPYISYDKNEGKFKPQLTEGTYLRLNPGEDGLLDITTLFKAYYGNNLYGIKEGKLLTYKIFNVSDDKPKFVFYKMFEIKKNSLCQDALAGDTTIIIKNTYVNLDDDDVKKSDRIFFKQQVVITSVLTIRPGMTFTLMYSSGELHYEGVSAPGFNVEIPYEDENDVNEIKSIKFTSTITMNSKSVFINFSTVKEKGYIVDNSINDYTIDLTDVSATSVEGDTLDVQTSVGSVIFGYEVLLRTETPNEVPLISAEPGTFNGKVVNFIVKDHN